MCGIAGVFGPENERVTDMLQVMRSRGPDAQHVTCFEDVAGRLGHARLSILDLHSRSNQPFCSPERRYWLTFNGEIYNYRRLRAKLFRSGHHFQTESDTEVLLHWLIEHGPDGLRDLDGMFAFAWYDSLAKRLLLARDPLGEKPLYYATQSRSGANRFAFASHISALKLVPWVDLSLDVNGLTDYLRFLYTPHPNTFYEGVKELSPGSYLEFPVDEAPPVAKRYFHIEEEFTKRPELTYTESVRVVHDALVDSVELRLQSDVPVGLFLSGGLDSNAILAGAAELASTDSLTAHTAAYGRSGVADGCESKLASESAAAFDVEHRFAAFEMDQPLDQSVERILTMFGQPYGNATALAADSISSHAARRSRVCLVGDGGDETLNGYPRHRAALYLADYGPYLRPAHAAINGAARLLPFAGRWEIHIDRLKRFAESATHCPSEAFLRWSTYATEEEILAATGLPCRSGFYEGLGTLFQRFRHDPLMAASLVDLHSFVPCNLTPCGDRAGMAHSLELRSPFLSPKYIAAVLSIPSRYKMKGRRVKPLLADAFRHRIPSRILKQPKRPFNPPMRRLLGSQIKFVRSRFSRRAAEIYNLVSREYVERKLTEFESRERDHSTLLWSLLVLDQWLCEPSRVARPTTRAAA